MKKENSVQLNEETAIRLTKDPEKSNSRKAELISEIDDLKSQIGLLVSLTDKLISLVSDLTQITTTSQDLKEVKRKNQKHLNQVKEEATKMTSEILDIINKRENRQIPA